ncbi:MAG: hypothetical protein IBX47_12035 [Desulfuromonadales bacterium]|nr:hypothetical protein [Desulfuromonadales bacterium]
MQILKRGPKAEVSSIDLLEEATHLLRRAPLAAWVAYYLCAVPFVLGTLFFVADMSRGAHAWEHLSEAALGMALLFALMKVGQALFCDRLLHHLNDAPIGSIWIRLPRIFFAQLALQPFGLFLLPVAALLTLPFGWCFALFQNFAVVGQGRESLRREIATAWHQAQAWPGQNHLTLGLLGFFWIILLPAIAASLYLFPHLLHTLFGIESIFVTSNLHLLNTTFWTVVSLFVYLLIDPLVKAAYVLRCFYGASLSSGADLCVELRRIQTGVTRFLLLGLTLASLTLLPASGWADQQTILPSELREAVATEMNSARYEWRQPREPLPENHDRAFLAPLGDAILDGLRWLGVQFKSLFTTLAEWLQKLMPDIEPNSSSAPAFLTEADPLLLALYLLCALGVSLAAIWLYRSWRRRQRRAKPSTEDILVVPDLESEGLLADALPADRWTALANDLLTRGEVRLALRALILGALARLADDGYLKLARYKSNRDYLREIYQRGQELTAVLAALTDNMTIMEGVWYGDHTIDQRSLTLFLTRHEGIMRYGDSV